MATNTIFTEDEMHEALKEENDNVLENSRNEVDALPNEIDEEEIQILDQISVECSCFGRYTEKITRRNISQ